MENSPWRYLRQFAVLTIALCAMLIGAGLILDPFELYHSSFFTKNESLFNKRYQNAGLIETEWQDGQCCDTLILGTSLSLNFHPLPSAAILKRKGVLNLAMPGAYPKETERLLKAVMDTGRPPQLVVWETIFREEQDDQHAAYSDRRIVRLNSDYVSRRPDRYFPEYLYDSVVYNDLPYLMSFDIFRNFARLYRRQHGSLMPGRRETENGQDAGLDDHAQDRPPATKMEKPRQKKFPLTQKKSDLPNIHQVLIRAVADHPRIEFAVFLPPFSRGFLARMSNGDFNRYMQMRRVLVDALAPFKNAKLYAFDTILDETGDMDFYVDARHYDARVSEKILAAIADGQGRLNGKNIEKDIRRLTDRVNAFR